MVLALGAGAGAQTAPMALLQKMVVNEQTAEQHRDHYMYLSKERSDRTGGHLWTERVVETDAGKVRLLLAEDGQPLAADRAAAGARPAGGDCGESRGLPEEGAGAEER